MCGRMGFSSCCDRMEFILQPVAWTIRSLFLFAWRLCLLCAAAICSSVLSNMVDIRTSSILNIPSLLSIERFLVKNTHIFEVHVTLHCDEFLIMKPTRCTNSSNLCWNETLRVLDRSLLIMLAGCQQICMTYTIAVYTVKNS
jgi:hypothetical protein